MRKPQRKHTRGQRHSHPSRKRNHRMPEQYRADHVGSFLRSPELLVARSADPPDPARLRAIEDSEIERVLVKQKELGFAIFTDGELRRSNFMGDFTDAVEGFDFGDGRSEEHTSELQSPMSL